MFAALGDDTRLHLVARLSAGGPQSIVALTDSVEVSRQAVTKHLVALEEAGLVRSSKDGRERIWELDPRRLSDAQRYLDLDLRANGIARSIACGLRRDRRLKRAELHGPVFQNARFCAVPPLAVFLGMVGTLERLPNRLPFIVA